MVEPPGPDSLTSPYIVGCLNLPNRFVISCKAVAWDTGKRTRTDQDCPSFPPTQVGDNRAVHLCGQWQYGGNGIPKAKIHATLEVRAATGESASQVADELPLPLAIQTALCMQTSIPLPHSSPLTTHYSLFTTYTYATYILRTHTVSRQYSQTRPPYRVSMCLRYALVLHAQCCCAIGDYRVWTQHVLRNY